MPSTEQHGLQPGFAWEPCHALVPVGKSTVDLQHVASVVQTGLQASGLFWGVNCEVQLDVYIGGHMFTNLKLPNSQNSSPGIWGDTCSSLVAKDGPSVDIYSVWRKGQDAGFIPNAKSHIDLL